MKKNFSIIFALLFIGVFASCKKDPGTGGKKNIKGTVTYTNAAGTTSPAAGALVSIKYGATDASANAFDATATTDGTGMYLISELTKGDYYIDATYTDQYGLTYNTPGTHVLIDKKKGDLTVDFNLK